jgi:hypothetical protein
MGLPWFKKVEPIRYDVKAANASRAIFQVGDGVLPKIRISLTTSNDEVIEMDMNYEIVAEFLDKVSIAYDATIPKRKY